MKAERVELDYFSPAKKPMWPGMLVLALSIAAAGYLVTRYRDAQLEVLRLEAASGLIAPQRAARPATPARLEDEARNAEAVVRQLTVPWAALIRTIEQAATKEVAILQLQPDAEQRVLRLTAEARSRDAMFDYLRRLSQARGLAEVHLVSHQVQRDDPQQPIQFAVQAVMRGLEASAR